MAETVWVQQDQLTLNHPALKGRDSASTTVLLIESEDWAQSLPHHKQKLALVWSAMRHFAEELREQDFQVDYHEATHEEAALKAHLRDADPDRVVVMETAEYGIADKSAERVREHGVEVEIVANSMFLSDSETFSRWTEKRKTLRMEDFYREMRRKSGLLMDAGEPAGGEWNYDHDNRDTPGKSHSFPQIPRFEPDATTRKVIALVEDKFPDHFGECSNFAWPMTRADAKSFACDFLDNRLDLFGPFQDAIVAGESALYHSLLSPLLNIGLLEPMWLCREAERRYRDGAARLNSVEGFIRQILGWREFVYQVYRHKMPSYLESNHFGAELPLPSFYWDGDTDMHCVSDAVGLLIRNGINHHIQRLMVTGNFALIAGIDPQAVTEWYWLGYADAWEWVVTPNVIGMALFADGGVLGSKPYAASANYIHRMSDYCGGCKYDRRKTVGENACPFNSLYWDFIDRNRDLLAGNRRMSLILNNWAKREPDAAQAIRDRAAELRRRLEDGERV